MNIKASRIGFGVFMLAAAVGSSAGGCNGCGCDKSDLKVAPVDGPKVQAESALPAENIPKPPPEPLTMDSPPSRLAEYFGMDAAELTRIKAHHKKLPGIVRPVANVPPPAEQDPSKIKPPEEWAKTGQPPPPKADVMTFTGDKVTGLPDMVVLTGEKLPKNNKIDPSEIERAIRKLRDSLFNAKLPVFSDPILLIDSPLDGPDADVTLTVGFPVPPDFRVPEGMESRKIPAGKCLFASHMRIESVGMSEETWRAFTSDSLKSLIGNPCSVGLFIDLDGWPEAGRTPLGDGYLYCTQGGSR